MNQIDPIWHPNLYEYVFGRPSTVIDPFGAAGKTVDLAYKGYTAYVEYFPNLKRAEVKLMNRGGTEVLRLWYSVKSDAFTQVTTHGGRALPEVGASVLEKVKNKFGSAVADAVTKARGGQLKPMPRLTVRGKGGRMVRIFGAALIVNMLFILDATASETGRSADMSYSEHYEMDADSFQIGESDLDELIKEINTHRAPTTQPTTQPNDCD